jgi:hypothetical protein
MAKFMVRICLCLMALGAFSAPVRADFVIGSWSPRSRFSLDGPHTNFILEFGELIPTLLTLFPNPISFPLTPADSGKTFVFTDSNAPNFPALATFLTNGHGGLFGVFLIDLAGGGGGPGFDKTFLAGPENTVSEVDFQVTLFSVVQTSNNPQSFVAEFDFTVEIIGTGPIHNLPAPAPTSILLAGIGAFGLIGYGWRRSRTAP